METLTATAPETTSIVVSVKDDATCSDLVVFDSRVDDLPQLLNGLRPGIASHVLNPERDGVEQISELLQQQPTASLTLVAHGFPGGLQLGTGALELEALQRYAHQLQTWFTGVKAPSLTLLACHSAAGDVGVKFIEQLAALTGAEVIATTRTVGNGQWPTTVDQTFKAFVLASYKATLGLIINSTFQDGQGVELLDSAYSVAVSPDGKQVFVVSFAEDSLTVFDRDTATGVLTFKNAFQDGMGGVNSLNGAYSVTVSPDGKQVFVASRNDDSLTVFDRDTATGVLTFKDAFRDGQGGINLLNGALNVTVSPDGKQVFVASDIDNSLTVFDRDAATGVLTFNSAFQDGQGGVDLLLSAISVTVSPDNKQVFVPGFNDDSLTVFDRDAATGVLTFNSAFQDGQGGVELLDGARSVTVSPDGKQVFVASLFDDSLTVFDRDAATGVLTFNSAFQDGQGSVELLDGAFNVTMSPDGQQVFVASQSDDSLTVFDRDAATGVLTFNSAFQDGQGSVELLDGARSVTVSPDGQQVFVASQSDDSLTVFDVDNIAPIITSFTRKTPATTPTDADTITFLATFSKDVTRVDANDFAVTGSTANIAVVTQLTPTTYDITVAGGDLANFNGTVGLDLATGQDITDTASNPLPVGEPTTDETYTLNNTSSGAQLTPKPEYNVLEVTQLGTANTVRLQLEQVNIADVAEILIFSTDATGNNRTQIGNFSLLQGGQLPDAYAPGLTLDKDQVTDGKYLQFELIINGETLTATLTANGSSEAILDFGDGTNFKISLFNQTTTTNLLMDDATAIDLTEQTGVVNVNFAVYREAAMDNTVGLYTTDFADGGIQDPLTNAILRPGDAGYKEAAMANRLDVELTGQNGQVSTFSTSFTGGGYLATFLIADGTDPAAAPVYFSHAGANDSSHDHTKLLGDNTFGFEDLSGLGDKDYNDVVVEIAMTS